MQEFEASAVRAWTDEGLDAEILILAERADGSGQRLEVQRPLNPTAEDRRLGRDTYSVGDESGAVVYGGVQRWSVGDSVVELHLEPQAAKTLAVSHGYRIVLMEPDAQRAIVDDALASIVGRGEG